MADFYQIAGYARVIGAIIILLMCHGILFLFFALFSCIVCFVSDNYLALMYCHIQS